MQPTNDDQKKLLHIMSTLPPEGWAEVVSYAQQLKHKYALTTHPAGKQRPVLKLPTVHLNAWPESLSLRRKDLYGDDGR